MKNLIKITCLILCISFNTMQAQSLSPFVVSSSGGFYSNSTAQLSFTIAEMTMVTTFTSPNNILTQGFQQIEVSGLSVSEVGNTNPEINVYPNPTKGIFVLSLMVPKPGQSSFKLVNSIGQVILTSDLHYNVGNNHFDFDISELASGIYVCFLDFENSNGIIQHKQYKVSLLK